MKSRIPTSYTGRPNFGDLSKTPVTSNERFTLTKQEFKQMFDEYLEQHCDELRGASFEQNKQDITAQLMSVVLETLYSQFDFDNEKLQDFKSAVEGMFITMINGGIFGKQFDTVTCIEHCREKFGIDLDANSRFKK